MAGMVAVRRPKTAMGGRFDSGSPPPRRGFCAPPACIAAPKPLPWRSSRPGGQDVRPYFSPIPRCMEVAGMAAQNHPASVSPRLRLAACEALRVVLFSAASLAGVGMLGCADAVTFSRSETTTGRTLLSEGESEEAAIIFSNQVRRNPKDYEAHFNLGQ